MAALRRSLGITPVVMILMLFYVLLSCILALHAPICAALHVLELDSSLTPASEPLYSSSSIFALSFRNPPGPSAASSTSNLFLTISFLVNSSPDYPAWVANRNTSVSASASLTLSSLGDLLLLDPSVSSSPIWKSDTVGLGVVQAQLLDSGNLVLLNSRSDYVWQSFHYPTDTLLPDQNFTVNSTNLISNKKSGDFHSGRYSFDLKSLVGVLQPNLENIDSMQFDKLGNITFYSSLSSNISTIVSNDHGIASMRRMTLDMDGNLRLYTWDVDAAQWNSVWMVLLDVCTQVPGVCGNYGVCTYDPIEPTCMCPQGFSVVDPTDLSSGCTANYTMGDDCSASFKYVEIENVDFPQNDYVNLLSVSIEECKQQCSNSCKCLAAVHHDSECWLKQEVRNGYVPMKQGYHCFLKISSSDPLVSSPSVDTAANWSSEYLWQPLGVNQTDVSYINNNKYFSTIIALAILTAIEGMCFAATVAAFIARSRRWLKSARLREELEGRPVVYSYEELRVATEDFCDKLGEGGFGTVYKGKLQNGKCVAVKQLECLLQQEKQFRAEIMTIGSIHHINLLRLHGFCSEGNHRLLVYEYMEKGSLDQILFQESDKSSQIDVLDWGTRFSICLGVARGIHYLHEECLNCILHCDIKPQNILLDRSYCAKVADFGLAYLHSRDRTVEMTTIRGTRGYLAPEWVSNLPITAKADVYSYGMLVMEIVSGRSNYLYTQSALVEVGEKWCFPMWAYGKRIEEVVDARLEESSIDWEQVDMVLKVAYACIQADMNARPTMGKVLQMLEGVLPAPEAAPPSLFSKDKRSVIINSPSPQTVSFTRNISSGRD